MHREELGGIVERVVFDVPAATDLADTMALVPGRAEQIMARIRQIDRPAWADGLTLGDPFGQRPAGTHHLGAGPLDRVVHWAANAADDLRWRLTQIRATERGLPPVVSHRLPDGRIEAGFPLRDRADELGWRTGMGLHDDLVAALEDIDGARADLLLDDLAAAVDDPMVLAGFASMLGATGLGDIVDRIDRAKERDPRWDTMAEWFGGSNPRWDSLEAELATIAAAAGGLASYGSDDRVIGEFEGGGVIIATMEHLLTTHPMVLAGRWSQGTDISRSRFAELGGVPVVLSPAGSNVVGPDRLLVTRVEATPGQAFHWDDDVGLQAVEFDMPSAWRSAWDTVDQVATNPWESTKYAASRPGDAARGFFIGAGLTLAVAGVWAAAPAALGTATAGTAGSSGVAGISGAGISAATINSGAYTLTQVTQIGFALNAGSVVTEAMIDEPCKGERMVLTGLGGLGGTGIGYAFSAGNAAPLATLVGGSSSISYGVTPTC